MNLQTRPIMDSQTRSKQSIYLLNDLDKVHAHVSLQPYQQIVKDFCSQGEFLTPDHNHEALACYNCDAQSVHTMQPLLVFRPYSLSTISPFIQTCYQLNLPVTARCGGSGLVGGAVPSQGGIVLLTGHFRSIIQYDKDQGTLIAESGVTPKQIKRLVHSDDWDLPLEMMSEGVAGLAGCLSSQAKGYHQTDYCITQNILSVIYVDETGQQREAPASLFCGGEGMVGIIIQLHLRLHRRLKVRRVFKYPCHFDLLTERLPVLSSCSVIKSMIWEPSQRMTCILEGDSWRVESVYLYLKEHFSNIQEQPNSWILDIRFPKKCAFFLLSVSISFASTPMILSHLEEGCRKYGLNYELWMNVSEGTMHLLLSAEEEPYPFLKKLEHWLVWWIHILEMYQGSCFGRHGIGPFLRHYVPPFYREEDLTFLKRFFMSHDSKQLFSRERFFPSVGKSLEKVTSSSDQLLVSVRAFKKIEIVEELVVGVEADCNLRTLQSTLYEWGYELGLEDWIWDHGKKTVAQAVISGVNSGLILRNYSVLDRLLGVDVIKPDGNLLRWGSHYQFSVGPHLHKLVWGCGHFDDLLVRCYFKVDRRPSTRLFLNWSFCDQKEMWQQMKRLQQFSSSWERLDYVVSSQAQERTFILAQISGTQEEMELFKLECPAIDQASYGDKVRVIRNFLLQTGFFFIPAKDETVIESLHYRWSHILTNMSWNIIVRDDLSNL